MPTQSPQTAAVIVCFAGKKKRLHSCRLSLVTQTHTYTYIQGITMTRTPCDRPSRLPSASSSHHRPTFHHIILIFSIIITLSLVSCNIVKRQTETTAHNENEQELCKGRPASEYFRLTADDDCRDVVRCSVQGLLALRCPSGLAFDIEKQTCDWKSNVKNCAQLESRS